MSRARNAVIIIILCIIGAYSVRKGPQLGLNMPGGEDIKDAVAGGPSKGGRGNANPLTLASGNGEDMRDAVAGHAVGTPNTGNSLGEVDGPPRGSGFGGFAPQSNNPGILIPPPPPTLSPSGPTTPTSENPGDETPETPGDGPSEPCNQGNGEGAGQGCINGGGNNRN